MSYIELINHFWNTRRRGRFSSNEADLYFFLLNECNIRGWENPFECTNGLITSTIGFTEKTLIEVRNRLQQKGLISFEKGQKKAKSPVYTLLYCNKVSKTESIKVSKTESIKVSKTVNPYKSKSKTEEDSSFLEKEPKTIGATEEISEIDFLKKQIEELKEIVSKKKKSSAQKKESKSEEWVEKVEGSKHGDGRLHFQCRKYHAENPEKYPPGFYEEFLSYWTTPLDTGNERWVDEKKKDKEFYLPLRLSTSWKFTKKTTSQVSIPAKTTKAVTEMGQREFDMMERQRREAQERKRKLEKQGQ